MRRAIGKSRGILFETTNAEESLTLCSKRNSHAEKLMNCNKEKNKNVANKTAITTAFSNAHARACVVPIVSLTSAGRVCSDMIAHELNVAALRRLEKAWLACDAGGGSRLQNKRGRASAKGKREPNCIVPPCCAINDGGHRESGAHRTLQSATVPCSARRPKQT